MRRTCYMEWNKGVAAEREGEEKGWHRRAKKKSGIVQNTKEGHTRSSTLRPGWKDRRGWPSHLTSPLHFNSFSPQEQVLPPEKDRV